MLPLRVQPTIQSVWQRKGHEHVATSWSIQLRCVRRKPIVNAANRNRQILPTTDRIRHRISGNLASQDRLPKHLPSFSINASVFSLFLKAYLEHLNVHAAWQPLAHYFSLSSAYRLWKRFGHGPQQASLRERLCRNRAPPKCTSKEPREQLIRHLLEAFKQQEDPIAAFQAEFQIPFWS